VTAKATRDGYDLRFEILVMESSETLKKEYAEKLKKNHTLAE